MFNFEFHNTILKALSALNADLLTECGAYFGGGTLVAMTCGEHRLSKDIDFLCQFGRGYSHLRRAVFDQGYDALFADRTGINLPGELRADQYGIRFVAELDGNRIKVEIVAEGRIPFEEPSRYPWLPVAALNTIDLIAEKLLANSDRWMDSSVFSRDLIDLGILRQQSAFPRTAFDKAEVVYPVIVPLQRAIDQFLENQTYQNLCFSSLGVTNPQQVIQGILQIAQDLG